MDYFFNPGFHEIEVTIFSHLFLINLLQICQKTQLHTKKANESKIHSNRLLGNTP